MIMIGHFTYARAHPELVHTDDKGAPKALGHGKVELVEFIFEKCLQRKRRVNVHVLFAEFVAFDQAPVEDKERNANDKK